MQLECSFPVYRACVFQCLTCAHPLPIWPFCLFLNFSVEIFNTLSALICLFVYYSPLRHFPDSVSLKCGTETCTDPPHTATGRGHTCPGFSGLSLEFLFWAVRLWGWFLVLSFVFLLCVLLCLLGSSLSFIWPPSPPVEFLLLSLCFISKTLLLLWLSACLRAGRRHWVVSVFRSRPLDAGREAPSTRMWPDGKLAVLVLPRRWPHSVKNPPAFTVDSEAEERAMTHHVAQLTLACVQLAGLSLIFSSE